MFRRTISTVVLATAFVFTGIAAYADPDGNIGNTDTQAQSATASFDNKIKNNGEGVVAKKTNKPLLTTKAKKKKTESPNQF